MKELKIETQLKQKINTAHAVEYQIIPVKYKENVLSIASYKNNPHLDIDEITVILNENIHLEYIDKATLKQILNYNYPQKLNSYTPNTLNYNEDFLSNIIQQAEQLKSSDIHFEIYESQGRIRYRLDGKLIEQYIIPKEEYPTLINKIKIMANLDIAEKRLPQDGRISIEKDISKIDIRVSILPSLHGEKAVLRLLSKDATNIKLDSLGFSNSDLKTYTKHIQKKHGIVLVSGPTGSGKTTTLYASLKELNKEDCNILTVEDPIEYTIEGITQVQLKENIGLSFPKVLKTFLRQDPDIIMIGEIRDVETANIAIRAALTGHLVISTIHTNSALSTISRLIDMGIPPFLIADTLIMSVAQRLVRKLCKYCKKEHHEQENTLLKKHNIHTHYVATGCSKCHYTGYSERQAIYEILPSDEDLVKEIKNNYQNLNSHHLTDFISLKKKAIDLVKQGVTSVDEIKSFIF